MYKDDSRRVALIGTGLVGMSYAYALLNQNACDELVLVDSNEKKVESECQDLRDSVAYLPHRVTVNIGTYEDLGDCDVIVNSIGKIEILRANQDRTDEMKFTVPAVNSYVGRVKASGFDGVVVNITNPCDVVTQQLAKGLGLPRGRVFGTGTGLDTSRLLSALARQTGIDHKSITAYMLGEHGNQQFAAWSNVSSEENPWRNGQRRMNASALTGMPCRRNPSAAAGSHFPENTARNTALQPRRRAW